MALDPPDGDQEPPPGWLTTAEWRRLNARVPLSERQRAVLRAVLEGQSDRAIGSRLGIAMPTVRTHIRSLFDLTGVNDRTAMVLQALRIALDRPARPGDEPPTIQ